MKKILRIIIVSLLILQPMTAFSQNWMMAQQYAKAALDSLKTFGVKESILYEPCNYTHYTYNPVVKEYTLYLHDYLREVLESSDPDSTRSHAVIFVRISGGKAIFMSDIYKPFNVQLPDWSGSTYIYNSTAKEISFSLSCNDSEFTTYSLGVNTFSRYECASDYLYIKISTIVGGAETAQIHYKLTKGKGYKVQYDSSTSKFDVFLDDRLM